MLVKAVLVVCAQAFLVQTAFSACAGSLSGYGLAGNNGLAGLGLAGGYGAGASGYGAGASGYGAGCGCGAASVASTGGGLPVSSASPAAPVGITVLSENAYEGVLSAGGNLPFLGSVGIEGVLPTAGAGAVSYGCGDGVIGIGSEGPIYTGVATPGAIFPPTSPSAAATSAVAAFGNGLGANAGYGLAGNAGYGLASNAGYGLAGNAGCGLASNAGYGLAGNAGYGLAGAGYNRGGCGCGALY